MTGDKNTNRRVWRGAQTETYIKNVEEETKERKKRTLLLKCSKNNSC